MATLINRVMFRAVSSGTGSFVVSAAVAGYMTPSQGDAVNAAVYSYAAESDDKLEWEIGTGTYSSGSTTLTRTAIKSSNANATVNFTAAPKVALTGLAADFQPASTILDTWAGLTPSANFQTLVPQTFAQMRASLDLEAGTDFYSISAANAAFQPLDSDLTSWAGVTRASGFDTFAATPSSANLRAMLTDETGTGIAYFVGGALGTPASGTATNLTGLPVATGISGLGSGVATLLATFSSANLRAALTDEVGTGAAYFVGGALGTPASGTGTNLTGIPIAGLTGSTSTALGVGSLEVGHASDTTISRGAAGFVAVEGNRVPSPASQVAGDILYRGTTEWERLPKGTAGQALVMNAGATAPEWGAGGSGQPIPSTTTFDVGTLAIMRNKSGGSVSSGATIAGSSLVTLRFGSSGTPQDGAAQSGTWLSVAGGATVNDASGYFVRIS